MEWKRATVDAVARLSLYAKERPPEPVDFSIFNRRIKEFTEYFNPVKAFIDRLLAPDPPIECKLPPLKNPTIEEQAGLIEL